MGDTLKVNLNFTLQKLFRRLAGVFLSLAFVSLSAYSQTIISQPPASQTNVSAGQTVAFSVGAFSSVTTNLQYQWKINGVNIPGATNATLNIPNAQPTNGGEFSVVVTDGQSATESSYAPLTFNVPFLSGNVFANRLALTPLTNGVIQSQNAAGSNSTSQPVVVSDSPGGKGGRRIWFKWTPTQTGIATFSTLGSGFETLLGAYIGTAVTNLVSVPSVVNDDDGAGNLCSLITFNAIAGTEYEIGVDGYWGAFGNVLLSWNEQITQNFLPSFFSLPPARTVVSNGAPVSFTAHWDTGACDWFFNGTDTSVEVNTISIAQAALSNVGRYVIQVTADNGINYTVGRPARLQVNVLQDGTTASGSFAWTKFLDAANSPFAPPVFTGPVPQDGGDTRGYSVTQTFSTVGTSSEPGEPSVCGNIPAHPMWYVYVAPTNGSMLINTAGSAFNTVLGVFVGPGNSFSTLTNIGCGFTTNSLKEGQPQVFLPSVAANQTNFIVVDGYKGAKGTVQLNIGLGNPVTVTTPPQNQAVTLGSSASMSVTCGGSVPVSYAWQLNGVPIPAATNNILALNNILAAQLGTYTVVISNLVSVTNVSATLSLLAPPQIVTPPASQTVNAGTNVTFNCQASGTGLGFQWLFGGAAAGGATNASFVLTNVQGGNSGNYACVVSNAAGAVTSAVAALTVQFPPAITVQPVGGTVPQGGNTSLSVTAASSPAPGYQWIFNGTRLIPNTSTLAISDFQTIFQGSYVVVVSNSLGSVTSATAVLALDSPLRLGVPTMNGGALQLQLIGPAGKSYVLQTSTNLSNWSPLLTNFTSNGFWNFTNSNLSGTARFYRGVTN